MNRAIKDMAYAGVIAGIYAALCILLAPLSFGPVQLRVSEALTVLPYFMPQAIWGLTAGCFLANFIGGFGILDIVFGTFATFLAALATSRIKNKLLAILPPVLINALIVGYVLYVSFANSESAAPMYIFAAQVGLGQLLACYGLGYPLMLTLERYKDKLKFLK